MLPSHFFSEVNVTIYSSAEEAIWGGIRKIGKRLQANHSLSGLKQRLEPLVAGFQCQDIWQERWSIMS